MRTFIGIDWAITATHEDDPNGLHHAISYARKKGRQGLDFHEIAEATERFLASSFGLPQGRARCLGKYAAQLIDDEIRGCVLDISSSTDDKAVVFNPCTGSRATVPMSDINEALRLLARMRGGNRS